MRNASDNSFGGVPEGARPSRMLSAYARSVGCGRAWVVADVGVDDVLVRLREVHEDLRVTQVLMGWPLQVVDMRRVAARAHEAGVPVVARLAPACGSAICSPGTLGADVVVERLPFAGRGPGAVVLPDGSIQTDVWDEEGPTTLCAVALRKPESWPELGEWLEARAASDSDVISALEALEGQNAAARHACDVARVCAEYLRCHPAVEHVRYPGLKDDEGHEVAAQVLHHGFGPAVDFWLAEGASMHSFALSGLARICTGRTGEAGRMRRLVCEGGDARDLVMMLEQALRQ